MFTPPSILHRKSFPLCRRRYGCGWRSIAGDRARIGSLHPQELDHHGSGRVGSRGEVELELVSWGWPRPRRRTSTEAQVGEHSCDVVWSLPDSTGATVGVSLLFSE
jgi:hypothetical protein